MKSITTLLAALALGTTFAVAADADKPKKDPAAMFKTLDSNNDGKVSADEFKAGKKAQKDPAKAEEMFAKKDKDGDKNLTMEEFTAAGGKKKKDQ